MYRSAQAFDVLVQCRQILQWQAALGHQAARYVRRLGLKPFAGRAKAHMHPAFVFAGALAHQQARSFHAFEQGGQRAGV